MIRYVDLVRIYVWHNQPVTVSFAHKGKNVIK